MIPHHGGLPATTHTLEMAQIDDINRRLDNSVAPIITAAELGMAGADIAGHGPGTLPGEAVLIRLSWDGSPEFPTVHGHFRDLGSDQPRVTGLHTEALREISRRLHLQQRWGI